MRNILISLFATVSLLLGYAQAAVNPEGARDAVIGVVDDFKVNIVEQRDELEGNPQKLQQAMRDILTPVVDFQDLAKKVMGKYYRRATPEQIDAFVEVTEGTLINTYSAAVIDFDPSRLEVLPLARQKPGKEVRVDAKFKLNDGSPVDIAFYMVPKDEQEGWRLNNVVINNINFGLTFRKQFGVMMQQNQNNLDKAILAWQESLAEKDDN